MRSITTSGSDEWAMIVAEVGNGASNRASSVTGVPHGNLTRYNTSNQALCDSISDRPELIAGHAATRSERSDFTSPTRADLKARYSRSAASPLARPAAACTTFRRRRR